MKVVYPVIFTEKEGTYLIEVPDLEILTEGKDLSDAIFMARDAIGLKGVTLEENNITIPEPSNIENIDIANSTFGGDGKSFISMIDIDFINYRVMSNEKW